MKFSSEQILKLRSSKSAQKTFAQNAGLETELEWILECYLDHHKQGCKYRMINITGKIIFTGQFRLIDSFPIEMQVSIMHIKTLLAIVECIIFIFLHHSAGYKSPVSTFLYSISRAGGIFKWFSPTKIIYLHKIYMSVQ